MGSDTNRVTCDDVFSDHAAYLISIHDNPRGMVLLQKCDVGFRCYKGVFKLVFVFGHDLRIPRMSFSKLPEHAAKSSVWAKFYFPSYSYLYF